MTHHPLVQTLACREGRGLHGHCRMDSNRNRAWLHRAFGQTLAPLQRLITFVFRATCIRLAASRP